METREDESMTEKEESRMIEKEESRVAEEHFTHEETLVIRDLLRLAPTPSCRETRKLLMAIDTSLIGQTYNRILQLSKATNKELIHYLGIMDKFPHPAIDLDLLADLKFTPQDKYTSNAIFRYFKLVEHYYDSMSSEQKLKVFYRYVYIFSLQGQADPSIYEMFKKILHGNFLDLFLCKKLFLSFPFIKEFIADFTKYIPKSVMRIGYELPLYRSLLYHCVLASSSLESLSFLDWITKRWSITTEKSIPELFYGHDCSLILESFALEKFQGLDNPLPSITNTLKNSDRCSVCGMNQNIESFIEERKQKRKLLQASVDLFNQKNVIADPLNITIIRLLPSIDIRSLGNFLCKIDNLESLVKYTESFDFNKMDILEALRGYLGSFVMSGESQVIDRIMNVFSNEYVTQNLSGAYDADTCKALCKKIAYGFIVLNTMLFNPSFEKKPSFEDYLGLMEFNETFFTGSENPFFKFTIEDLRVFYEAIKENEMKIPSMWTDSHDKLVLFSRLFPNQDKRKACNEICDQCTIASYRSLFKDSHKSFMFLSPDVFFQITRILDCFDEFEEYIKNHRKDIPKFLESARLYIEHKTVTAEFITNVFEILEKTEKPRSTVLPDIRSMFSKVSLLDVKEKPISILPHLNASVESFLTLKFSDRSIGLANLKIIDEVGSARKWHSKSISRQILLNNVEMLENLTELSADLQLRILERNPQENFKQVSTNVRIKFLIDEIAQGRSIDDYHHSFMTDRLNTQEWFDVFCFYQQHYDDFNQIVTIKRVSINGSDSFIKEAFVIDEWLPELLSTPTNILKLFTSTCSVLNAKMCKKIHKDGCPTKDPKFRDFDKIAYLVLKCDRKDKVLLEYATCAMNYLSDSLILLVDLYEYIFPIFQQLSHDFAIVLAKILLKRARIFADNGVACCDQVTDAGIQFRLNRMISRLQTASLVSSTDLKPISKYSIHKPESVDI